MILIIQSLAIKRFECQDKNASVFDELIDEVRRSQNATDRFDQAVADALGLNRTDMRCLDVLQREGPRDRRAAGRGDRADERRDDDRARPARARRLRAPGARPGRPPARAGRAHGTGGADGRLLRASTSPCRERLYQRYTEEQLELLLEFVREDREFNERHAAEIEQRNRAHH